MILMHNKKGQSIVQLFIFVAIVMVIVLFFAVWLFGFNTLTETLDEIELPTGTGINFSEITRDTIDHVNTGMGFLRTIAVLMIFGFAISILLSSFLEKTHPGLGFVIHIFVTALAIPFAVVVSNAYEDLLADAVIGPTLQTFTGANFIVLNLPLWVVVIGIAGIILLMSGIPKDRELGGGAVK